MTGLSRILGFVRDWMIAALFGTGVNAEAFVVSFRIPNLLRDLAGEGAANAAIVPVLTEYRQKEGRGFWSLVSTLFVAMTGALALLSLLGILFAPQIVRLIVPGFVHSVEAGKLDLTVHFTRFLFPYLVLIGLSALAMGVLNSLGEFTSSAVGPVLLNACLIAAGFLFGRSYGPMALVAGVLIGGVLQLGCQARPLLKKARLPDGRGFHPARPDFRMEPVRQIAKLFVPRILGSALYQFNTVVDSVLASFEGIVGLGGQSALYYANRLFQLPLAVFGLALAQAALPAFSAQAARGDMGGFKETLSLALRSILVVILPALVGLLVLSEPIVRILFQHGEFTAYSTRITSGALFYYALGLLSCAFLKILANAFYAMQDTKTPVKVMGVCLLLNISFSLVLMRPLQVGGLALASTFSTTANMLCLYALLRKRIGALQSRKLFSHFCRIFAAAFAMGIAAFFYRHFVLERIVSEGRLFQALCLAGGILLSILMYGGFLLLFRVEEGKAAFRWFRKRPSP